MATSRTTTVAPDHSPLPKERPPIRNRSVPPVDWSLLIEQFVHEIKIGVLEALSWIGQPLSINELWRILGKRGYSYGLVSHHVRALATRGLIEPTDYRDAGSTREAFYLPTSGTQQSVR